MAMLSPDWDGYPKTILPMSERSTLLIVTDKIHDSDAQWDDRRIISKRCIQRPEVCVTLNPNGNAIDHVHWVTRVAKHQFIVCGHGGGLDPSPKAWESIKLGTIPIIEENPIIDAYSHLPIAWVKDLKDFMLWPNITTVLEEWRVNLGPYYEPGSYLRNQTLLRLTGKYWYKQIIARIPRRRHTKTHDGR
jgi:hypothetical protein